MKSTSYIKKYWFAVGYHHCMNHYYDAPSDLMVEYNLELSNIDILKEYQDGRRAAEKDMKNGNY